MASRRRPHRGFPPKRGVSTLGGNGLEASDGSSNRSLFARREKRERFDEPSEASRPLPPSVETPRFGGNPRWGRLLEAISSQSRGRSEDQRQRAPKPFGQGKGVASNPHPPSPLLPAPPPPAGRRGSDLTNRRRPQDRCHPV